MAVCLLISPHYFPRWALTKWPQCVNVARGFAILPARPGRPGAIAAFHRGGHPAIERPSGVHSICLSNEPVNEERPCAEARKLWRAWLEKRHGTIAALNARWGSKFASFAEAPLPDPFARRPAQPAWMDYIRFNQEFFADWHQMLADAVHEVAPACRSTPRP